MQLHASVVIVVTISSILFLSSLSSGQLYFPDDNTEKIMQQMQAALGAAPPASSVGGAPLPNFTVEFRQTTEYEEYVNRIISQGILNLTLSINKAIVGSNKNALDDGDLIYAPVSIAAALALTLLGSNGKTFEELSTIMGLTARVNIQNKSQLVHEQFGRMLDLLQATSGFEIGSQVNFATAIFLQSNYPIRQAYKQTAESVYDSEVLNVDFLSDPDNAQQVINAWVSDRTQGKITKLLSDKPGAETKVILASAMYFKAEWERHFFEGNTRKRPFYTNGRRSKSEVMVEMMSNGGNFPYYKDSLLDCEIIGFPYKGNRTTMYVVIPQNSDKTRLKELEERLTLVDIDRLVTSARYTGAVVLFPKMKIESTLDLRSSLQQLGVKTLFDPAQANLALLSPGVIPPGTNGLDKTMSVKNPLTPEINPGSDDQSVFIFSRTGAAVNCTQIFDPASNIRTCQDVVNATSKTQTVIYKKFGDKVGRRIARKISPRIVESLDSIREYLNKQADPSHFENPGLYVDSVIHKVYMDITESGTEAAAATAVSLSRDGGRVTVRVDVPFLFFIMHEQTKTVMFWGSVHTPTPNFK